MTRTYYRSRDVRTTLNPTYNTLRSVFSLFDFRPRPCSATRGTSPGIHSSMFSTRTVSFCPFPVRGKTRVCFWLTYKYRHLRRPWLSSLLDIFGTWGWRVVTDSVSPPEFLGLLTVGRPGEDRKRCRWVPEGAPMVKSLLLFGKTSLTFLSTHMYCSSVTRRYVFRDSVNRRKLRVPGHDNRTEKVT